MANLRETSTWEAGIYQWETSDPVMGGADGIDNRPTRQLANRTLWLKTELAKAVASIGQNKTAADQGLAGKVDKTTQVTAGAGLTGGGALGGNIQIQLGTPGKLNGTTTNWAGSNTHTHEIDKATPTVAGVAKLIDNLTAGGTDAALTAEQGKALKQLIDAGVGNAVPYTGATRHVDLNGKNLNNVGELKLGDGRSNVYQQLIFGNYERSPGNGNYGAVSNSKFSGPLRWAAISNYGEDGQHISSLFADTAKAYVRIGSTNYELAKAADTILAQSGTFTGAVGYNRILSVNNGNDGMPDGAYKYGLGLSLASGNGKAQLYIAHTGGVYARGGYHTHPMQQWYRVDGADWSDVRGKPTNLAGYGITDAARKVDMRSHIPSTSTPWQAALPNQIPEGIYEGLTNSANLQGGGMGVLRIVKAWYDATGHYAVYREGTLPTGEIYRQYANSNLTAWGNRIRVDGSLSGNLAEQGWTKLPNGLILQWGQADGSNRANFPIAFNQCFSCAVMETNTNDTWNYAFAHDNTSIWVSMRGDKIRGFKYIAIGR